MPTTTKKTTKKYPENISLNGDRKLINAVKKAGLKTINPNGPYNGYGYEKLPLHVVIESLGDKRKFNSVKNEISDVPKKAPKTEEQKMEEWARRLSKLTGMSHSEAMEIAEEKSTLPAREGVTSKTSSPT